MYLKIDFMSRYINLQEENGELKTSSDKLQTQIDKLQTDAIIKAYWEYKEDRYKDREKRLTINYIGIYKSNEILEIKCDVEGVDVSGVIVPIIINGMLIRNLPDPRYDLMLYTQELKCISVYEAYAIGMITDADLSELAEICSNYD